MATEDLPTDELVAKIRADARFTQEELAHHLGVAFSTVNAWEVGRSRPRPRHRRRLEEFARELSGDTGPMHVLVVDDDATELALLGNLVEDAGEALDLRVQVTTESDGMRGLIALGRLQPAVAFVDVIMPGLDGFALADRVSDLDGFSTGQLVLVTAGRDPRITSTAQERQLTLLEKPLTLRAVGGVLRDVMSRRSS